MVVMALVTTAMTAPLLRWAYPSRLIDADLRELAEQRVGEPKYTELARPVGAKRPGGGVTARLPAWLPPLAAQGISVSRRPAM